MGDTVNWTFFRRWTIRLVPIRLAFGTPPLTGAHVTLVLRPEDIHVGSLSMPNGRRICFPRRWSRAPSQVTISVPKQSSESAVSWCFLTRPADASIAVEIDLRKIDGVLRQLGAEGR